MSASYAAELVALAARHWGPRNKARSTRKDARFGTNGSKSVNLDDATWYDHEAEVGGGFRELYKLVHGEFPENGSREASGRFNVVAEYNYRDHDGQLLFQVVRLSPKDFRQRRPDGNGGWDLEDGRRQASSGRDTSTGPALGHWSPPVLAPPWPAAPTPRLFRRPPANPRHPLCLVGSAAAHRQQPEG